MNIPKIKESVNGIIESNTSASEKLQNICNYLKQEIDYFHWVGFYFKNGNFSEDVAFPFSLSPNTFTFFSSNGSQDTDLLIQTQLFPNLLGVEGCEPPRDCRRP